MGISASWVWRHEDGEAGFVNLVGLRWMNREECIGVGNMLLELAWGELLENGSKVVFEVRSSKVLIYTNFLLK